MSARASHMFIVFADYIFFFNNFLSYGKGVQVGMAMGRVWIVSTHTRPKKFTHGYLIVNTR